MIICDDADLGAAASAASMGRFYNCGQACLAVKRVYVFESVAEQVIEQITAKANRLTVGPGDVQGSQPRLAPGVGRIARRNVDVAAPFDADQAGLGDQVNHLHRRQFTERDGHQSGQKRFRARLAHAAIITSRGRPIIRGCAWRQPSRFFRNKVVSTTG